MTRAEKILLAVYTTFMVGAVAMVAGPAINDATIAADPGRGLATVTGIGAQRTSVEYQDEDGQLHSPRTGLLYPTGLGEGQHVWVTYAKSNPDLVKVEGRGWHLAMKPALSVAVAGTLVAAGIWYLLARQGLTGRGLARRGRGLARRGRRKVHADFTPGWTGISAAVEK